MPGSPRVHVTPAPGKTCPLPMGAGPLPLEGALVTYDNHWRLMVKEGRAVRTDVGAPGDAVKTEQAVIADRADGKVARLEAQLATLERDLTAAKADAKAKREVAKETGEQAQKRAKKVASDRADKEAAELKRQEEAANKVRKAGKSKK